MKYLEIDYGELNLDFPRFNPEHARHFGQYFRLHNLLMLLGVYNTGEWAERYARSYNWGDEMCNVSELLATRDPAANIPVDVGRAANKLERDFRGVLAGVSLDPLRTMTFKQIAEQFSVGFASCFMGDFYCLKCDEIENVQGVLVNSSYGVATVSEDAIKLHEHFKTGRISDPYPNTQSCPYCQPANFDLGSWKRLLNRAPNVCECDACRR